MRLFIFILGLFLATNVIAQDNTYMQIKDGRWDVQVHPDSLAVPIGILDSVEVVGPEVVHNILTGELWVWNPSDSSWTDVVRLVNGYLVLPSYATNARDTISADSNRLMFTIDIRGGKVYSIAPNDLLAVTNSYFEAHTLPPDKDSLAFLAGDVTPKPLDSLVLHISKNFSIAGDSAITYDLDRTIDVKVSIFVEWDFSENTVGINGGVYKNDTLLPESLMREVEQHAGNLATKGIVFLDNISQGDVYTIKFYPDTHSGDDYIVISKVIFTVTNLN